MSASLSDPPLRSDESNGAKLVLGLFFLRWIAGIAENHGVPAASQLAALLMLGGLGLLFLVRMRLRADASLLLAGLGAWIFSGSLSLAANPGISLETTIALLGLLALYAAFANASFQYLQGTRALRLLYRLMAAFVIVGCLLSLYQLAMGKGFVEQGKTSIQRAYGSDVHPVSFAIQVLAAMIAAEVLRLRLGRRVGLLHILIVLCGTVALYLTYARTAWVMALITCAWVLLLHGSVARRMFTGMTVLAGGLLFLTVSDRFADLASLPVFLANFSMQDAVFDWRFVDNSISWRIVNWNFGLLQGLEQPLLGFGPGQSASSSYFSLEMHNIFLEAFFEGGLVGLCALLLTLGGLFRLHKRLPRNGPIDRRVRTLANGFGLALLLAVTFSTSFVDQLMSFLIYILLLAAAASTFGPQTRIGQT